ncbi:phytanoyl-CoA dioxygenase family protein [Mucilaginibacter sabulilitoris]|uniref:Phytanoyl-CoA dioxygenase family protein n=1 Tax=Mucilaginibacter sabulilitoris TaxID=1173583 RepID=A0ABZ0TMU2_9SPHI|nr:phytanoyl-CoA dioxygenase family protein [Mucilaginibacter sabulilitoris]WPU92840.1 phytanoyl-CoA dioxygenase family protein [Mucilaginibacter sabulilitoris]
MNILSPAEKAFFEKNGYLVVENIISAEELRNYCEIYDQFLNGTIDAGKNRTDLGVGLGNNKSVENITQIMWPSDFFPPLVDMAYHKQSLKLAKELEGEDMAMDFDMLINKAPHTATITPWHQDAAYWINMPDKRAVSFWLALDEAILDNGCMWYVPGSHLLPLRTHRSAGGAGSALSCEATETEGIGIELKAGSCVLHHGATLHYSRGNTTGSNRRALIINFRPKQMIDLEREQGFDHGRTGNAAERQARNSDVKS